MGDQPDSPFEGATPMIPPIGGQGDVKINTKTKVRI